MTTQKNDILQANIKVSHNAQQFDAFKQLYSASCFIGDGQAAEKYRTELHSILDNLLDTLGTSMVLARRSIESGG
jgi:hypothetical protein